MIWEPASSTFAKIRTFLRQIQKYSYTRSLHTTNLKLPESSPRFCRDFALLDLDPLMTHDFTISNFHTFTLSNFHSLKLSQFQTSTTVFTVTISTWVPSLALTLYQAANPCSLENCSISASLTWPKFKSSWE